MDFFLTSETRGRFFTLTFLVVQFWCLNLVCMCTAFSKVDKTNYYYNLVLCLHHSLSTKSFMTFSVINQTPIFSEILTSRISIFGKQKDLIWEHSYPNFTKSGKIGKIKSWENKMKLKWPDYLIFYQVTGRGQKDLPASDSVNNISDGYIWMLAFSIWYFFWY